MELPSFPIHNAAELPTPTLVLNAERVTRNLQRMVAMAGGPERLRPHIKTHKLPQLIYQQLDLGIRKFKCATIAEAEMAALSGVPDILLATQPVGANAMRWAQFIVRFPNVNCIAIVDDPGAVQVLGEVASVAGIDLALMVDLNVGQNRSGILPDERAFGLYQAIAEHDDLRVAGLHAYDGHLTQSDPGERRQACDEAFAPVWKLRQSLLDAGYEVPEVVAGGSPTFPFHAENELVTCSPGTTVLWDAGYAEKFSDLDFQPAAQLVARVISKPSPNRLCLDLGHKAVASEMPQPRVFFPDWPEAVAVLHNEEHLVLETSRAQDCALGEIFFGYPRHICPTVALHSEVWVCREGEVTEAWPVVGRTRRLGV